MSFGFEINAHYMNGMWSQVVILTCYSQQYMFNLFRVSTRTYWSYRNYITEINNITKDINNITKDIYWKNRRFFWYILHKFYMTNKWITKYLSVSEIRVKVGAKAVQCHSPFFFTIALIVVQFLTETARCAVNVPRHISFSINS